MRQLSPAAALAGRRRRRRLRGRRRAVPAAGPGRHVGDLVRTVPDGESGARTGGSGPGRPTEAGEGGRGPGAEGVRAVHRAGRAHPDDRRERRRDVPPSRCGAGRGAAPLGRRGPREQSMTTGDGPAETPDLAGAYPRLTHRQLSQVCRRGRRRPIRPGEVLVAEGQRDRDFMVVLSGKVAVVEGYDTPRSRVIRVHGRHRFLDELGLLPRQPSFVTVVAVEPGEILAVP